MNAAIAGGSQNSGGERIEAQPRGPTYVQTRSERREGGRRGGEIPRQVGANLIRNPARSGSEATPWLQPADREGHGPTSASSWGWSSCVLRSTIPPTGSRQQPDERLKAQMKIDFELLEQMAAAGTPAQAIIVFLRSQYDRREAKRAVKRPKDAERQRKRRGPTKSDKGVTLSDSERHEATLSDTPRARLFREAKPALLTMNISDSRAGALIVGWLKLTHDDDQLVLATILRAQSLAVADAPGWILATLKGKTNGNGTGAGANPASNQSGSTAIIAGVAAATERRARERNAAGQHRPAPPNDDPAKKPDPELFGAR